jgi:hypothetical protein
MSSKTCIFCKFVLHVAVSNYRRSLERPKNQYRWRRFESVHIKDITTEELRESAHVKELRQCAISTESDDNPKDRGGYFTPEKTEWDAKLWFNGITVIAKVLGLNNASGVKPVEDAPIDVDELRKHIPNTNSV